MICMHLPWAGQAVVAMARRFQRTRDAKERTLMSPFDNIIDDVAGRFGLGAKAGPLLRELLLLMTGSSGGISGFIDKFKSAGLSSEVNGWLGSAGKTAAAPTSWQVEQALGSKTV